MSHYCRCVEKKPKKLKPKGRNMHFSLDLHTEKYEDSDLVSSTVFWTST